ncbi:MAG: DUF2264 domain-containing protein [Parvibaculaceae bacterium]
MAGFDYPAGFCNPMGGNPLRTRRDVEHALQCLVAPLEKVRSPGGARFRLSHWQAHFGQEAADLEGFARPLWALAPAQAGGARWIDWRPIRQGLAAGADPDHPEYWRKAGDHDQRLVELAAIGLALRLAPDRIWHPLPERQKEQVLAYLLAARRCAYHNSNWKFFRLLLDLGLDAVGAPPDEAGNRAAARDIEGWHRGGGWYVDGEHGAVDHYAAFSFHYFGLVLARLERGRGRSARYIERARESAKDIIRWFADDGPAIAYGRSMTYRFAAAGYLGALAFAEVEAMPWGVLKGFYLRHLRWWSKLPLARSDGVLDVGYAYPNATIAEAYNSPQSSYWALQAFLPLALPASHPFWRSEEAPAPGRPRPAVLGHARMIVANPPGDAVVLSAGAIPPDIRYGPEKYGKFAYSARYGFSVESDLRRFDRAVLDNALGFSEDGRHFRVRQSHERVKVAGEMLYSLWRPYPDIKVESWSWWHGPFHIRVHRIETEAPITTIEGGFAIRLDDPAGVEQTVKPGLAAVATAADHSAILDLGSTVARRMRVHRPPPDTNLVAPRTMVPQLFAELPAGTTVLACAVIAQGDSEAVRLALARPPPRPDLGALRALMADAGPAGAAAAPPR